MLKKKQHCFFEKKIDRLIKDGFSVTQCLHLHVLRLRLIQVKTS